MVSLGLVFAITRSGKRIVKFGTKYCGKSHNYKLLESESTLAFRLQSLIVLIGRKIVFNLIIDAIGAICLGILVLCMILDYSHNAKKNSRTGQISMDDYLRKITRITGHSAYDTFHKSAEGWHVSDDRIDQDFRIYLSIQSVPYYVKDFVRKSQGHIDELYRGQGRNFSDKRLLLFYLCLTVFFWGGAVFLSLYVIPHLVPLEVRSAFMIGSP